MPLYEIKIIGSVDQKIRAALATLNQQIRKTAGAMDKATGATAKSAGVVEKARQTYSRIGEVIARQSQSFSKAGEAAAKMGTSITGMAKGFKTSIASSNKLKATIDKTAAGFIKSSAAAKKWIDSHKKAALASNRTAAETKKILASLDKLTIAVQRASRAKRQNAESTRLMGSAFTSTFVKIGVYNAILVSMYLTLRRLITGFINIVDPVVRMENQLRVSTATAIGFRKVQRDLIDIANKTGQSVQNTAQVYQRFRIAMSNTGATQKEVLKVTETLQKTTLFFGLGALEARGAMLQLSQGMAAGQLRGHELIAVMEQMPPLAQAIAEELGIFTGELRQAGERGDIDMDVISGAMDRLGKRADVALTKIQIPLGQLLLTLRTQLAVAITEVTRRLGAGGLGRAVVKLRDEVSAFNRDLQSGMSIMNALPRQLRFLGLAGKGALEEVFKVIQYGWEHVVKPILGGINKALGWFISATDQLAGFTREYRDRTLWEHVMAGAKQLEKRQESKLDIESPEAERLRIEEKQRKRVIASYAELMKMIENYNRVVAASPGRGVLPSRGVIQQISEMVKIRDTIINIRDEAERLNMPEMLKKANTQLAIANDKLKKLKDLARIYTEEQAVNVRQIKRLAAIYEKTGTLDPNQHSILRTNVRAIQKRGLTGDTTEAERKAYDIGVQILKDLERRKKLREDIELIITRGLAHARTVLSMERELTQIEKTYYQGQIQSAISAIEQQQVKKQDVEYRREELELLHKANEKLKNLNTESRNRSLEKRLRAARREAERMTRMIGGALLNAVRSVTDAALGMQNKWSRAISTIIQALGRMAIAYAAAHAAKVARPGLKEGETEQDLAGAAANVGAAASPGYGPAIAAGGAIAGAVLTAMLSKDQEQAAERKREEEQRKEFDRQLAALRAQEAQRAYDQRQELLRLEAEQAVALENLTQLAKEERTARERAEARAQLFSEQAFASARRNTFLQAGNIGSVQAPTAPAVSASPRIQMPSIKIALVDNRLEGEEFARGAGVNIVANAMDSDPELFNRVLGR